MVINRNISRFLVLAEDSIRTALAKIDLNEHGIVFCVSTEGALVGVLSDGDFRRWAIKAPHFDLDLPVGSIANPEPMVARVTDSYDKIRNSLSTLIKCLPLLDNKGRLVAIASDRAERIVVGDFKIGGDSPAFVIAEIGNNHNGDLALAKRLVDEAIASGADCAKFQMRDLQSLYSNAGNASDAREDLGSQYTLDLLSRFQLSRAQMFEAFDYCRRKGILPLCTPWDMNSLAALEEYGMEAYKVASADLTNPPFLEALARTGKPLICSTGMSMESEITEAISLLKTRGAQFILLHCNSAYPAPFKDINLSYMTKLKTMGECPVGYSGHERGIFVPVAAVSLGAKVIEKHFTLDRNMEGSDHRVSLLPAEFAEMVRAIRQVESALGSGAERRMSQGEVMNRETLGKSLVVNTQLEPGEIIQESMVEVRSPGKGLKPYRKRDVVGKAARRALKAGDILYEQDVSDASPSSRRFSFERAFGIPVRYHDMRSLALKSNFDLIEFHLSYKDLDEEIDRHFSSPLDMDLVVHAPELFEGDHILDLCANDEDYRRRSLRELGRVIGVARHLKRYFTKASRPRIVVNAGGFTQDSPLEPKDRAGYYGKVLQSLSELDREGVEIIPQTMPPFPWHFGGQRYQNLFIEADEIVRFCATNNYRVCLDVSHSKLACTAFKWSFSEFLQKVGPYVAHLHIADARGVDGEGLQIYEGDIDFGSLGKALRTYAPRASFIPEIWQGHKNDGEGFWIALDRLEKYL